MPIDILMPALSPTMTEGNLARWIKKEGDKVEPGDVIAEIETDKATMEVEAVDEGTIGKILVQEGTEGVPVNDLIAVLLEEDEDSASIDEFIASRIGSAPANENNNADSAAPEVAEATPAAAQPSNVTNINDRVKASPLAKRIAEQNNVSLGGLSGTGPHGRIIKADVEDAMKNPQAASAPASFTPTAIAGRHPEEYTEVPNNNVRKVIAKRLLESKQQVPHFYLNIDCSLDKLLNVRKEMNQAALDAAAEGEKPAYKLSVNDFIIKASAMALQKVPQANASWTDAAIQLYNNVDISVAVVIDGGLITPIVKNADQKSISLISNEMKDLAKRARDNKLTPEEFQGGGFSISNLGMYGIKRFNAIVNPPQAAILAVGAGDKRPVFDKNGNVVAATVMDVTLSSDHRVVDGAVGAEFLAAFKAFIENPVTMLV